MQHACIYYVNLQKWTQTYSLLFYGTRVSASCCKRLSKDEAWLIEKIDPLTRFMS